VRELRRDPHLGTRVHVDGSRLHRPQRPVTDCPFCVGGLEAPEPYSVRCFPNRWPALGEGNNEVVLFSPDHDASLATLGVDGVRRVIDLWAERTAALGARPDVEYVLVFENRGAEVGATIAHPHGQIYAFDHVPDRPARLLAAGWCPDPAPGARLVATHADWSAWVPWAPTYPVELHVAPMSRIARIHHLDDVGRTAMATILVDVLGRLDRLFERPLPYMLWLEQAPTGGDMADTGWLHVRIVSPWRRAGLQRIMGAAEVATDEYVMEVVPEDLAGRLRDATGDAR
jgi:UDPglucose--hexose-1-phosphate uridylyltransferase